MPLEVYILSLKYHSSKYSFLSLLRKSIVAPQNKECPACELSLSAGHSLFDTNSFPLLYMKIFSYTFNSFALWRLIDGGSITGAFDYSP